LLAFVSRGDQGHTAIHLVDNLEDPLLSFLPRSLRCEQPSDPEMSFGARFFRERIGRFLDTIVKKPVRIFRAQDKAGPDGFPEILLHFIARIPVSKLSKPSSARAVIN
jgi:hypothetical protein